MATTPVNDEQFYSTPITGAEQGPEPVASPTFTGRIVMNAAGSIVARNTMFYRGYNGSVEVSIEDDYLHGKVEGIRSLITYQGRTPGILYREFMNAIDAYLADCHADGKEPEQPKGGA